MKKKKTYWILRMLNDHNLEPSSKRFLGVLSALTLIYSLLYNTWYPDKAPKEYIIDAISLLTFGLLGLTTTEKIMSIIKSSKQNKELPKKDLNLEDENLEEQEEGI